MMMLMMTKTATMMVMGMLVIRELGMKGLSSSAALSPA